MLSTETRYHHPLPPEQDWGERALAPCLPSRPRHDPLLRSFSTLAGRVGIFGGTFDPLQIAHIASARKAYEGARLDSVVFIPTTQNPLKGDPPDADEAQRLEMLEVGLAMEEDFFVSPIEITSKEGPSYTFDTVQAVRAELQNDSELFMIVGSDIVSHFHKWHRVHELLTLIDGMIVIERKGYGREVFDTLDGHFSANEIGKISNNFISDRPLDVSSSQVRDLLAHGELPIHLVPESVLDLVVEWDLYTEGRACPRTLHRSSVAPLDNGRGDAPTAKPGESENNGRI